MKNERTPPIHMKFLGSETHGRHVNTTCSLPIIFHAIHSLIILNFNANGTVWGCCGSITQLFVCSMFIRFHIVDSKILQITIIIIVNSRRNNISTQSMYFNNVENAFEIGCYYSHIESNLWYFEINIQTFVICNMPRIDEPYFCFS